MATVPFKLTKNCVPITAGNTGAATCSQVTKLPDVAYIFEPDLLQSVNIAACGGTIDSITVNSVYTTPKIYTFGNMSTTDGFTYSSVSETNLDTFETTNTGDIAIKENRGILSTESLCFADTVRSGSFYNLLFMDCEQRMFLILASDACGSVSNSFEALGLKKEETAIDQKMGSRTYTFGTTNKRVKIHEVIGSAYNALKSIIV